MKTKRICNTTAIKVQFLGITNDNGARLKFTQLNNKKSATVECDINLTPIEQTELILNSIPELHGFILIIDNTQSKYNLFALSFESVCIPDFISTIKKLYK